MRKGGSGGKRQGRVVEVANANNNVLRGGIKHCCPLQNGKGVGGRDPLKILLLRHAHAVQRCRPDSYVPGDPARPSGPLITRQLRIREVSYT